MSDKVDAARYRAIRKQLYWAESFDVGEASVRMKVIGNCPTAEEFDAAADGLANYWAERNSARDGG